MNIAWSLMSVWPLLKHGCKGFKVAGFGCFKTISSRTPWRSIKKKSAFWGVSWKIPFQLIIEMNRESLFWVMVQSWRHFQPDVLHYVRNIKDHMVNIYLRLWRQWQWKVQIFPLPLPAQYEHLHLLPWYSFFPLPLPSQLGTDPILWRHQNIEKYVVAVAVWTSFYCLELSEYLRHPELYEEKVKCHCYLLGIL